MAFVVARTGGDEFAVMALDRAEPHLRVPTSASAAALGEPASPGRSTAPGAGPDPV